MTVSNNSRDLFPLTPLPNLLLVIDLSVSARRAVVRATLDVAEESGILAVGGDGEPPFTLVASYCRSLALAIRYGLPLVPLPLNCAHAVVVSNMRSIIIIAALEKCLVFIVSFFVLFFSRVMVEGEI